MVAQNLIGSLASLCESVRLFPPALLPKQRIHQPALPNPNSFATSATCGLVAADPRVHRLEGSQVVTGQRGVYLDFEDGGTGPGRHPSRQCSHKKIMTDRATTATSPPQHRTIRNVDPTILFPELPAGRARFVFLGAKSHHVPFTTHIDTMILCLKNG